jgi:predicted transcriptional regulator of viral defense system
LFPDFDNRRLFEWQKKGYIKKLVNKWYFFEDLPHNEALSYRISNCIYQPSYVSLESAFSYYDMIPEGVYSVEAISSRKTVSYRTSAGLFNYRRLPPSLFFGYQIIHYKELPVLMAGPEKALLDYLYFGTGVHSIQDLEAIRFNRFFLQNDVDWNLLEKYIPVFGSKILRTRVDYLKKLLDHAIAG